MFRNPTTDVILVLVVVLFIFGPKRLPELGKSLGSGIKGFKDAITGRHDDDDEREREALPAAHEAPVTSVPAHDPAAAPAPEAGAGSRTQS